jgi:hypothetical protein
MGRLNGDLAWQFGHTMGSGGQVFDCADVLCPVDFPKYVYINRCLLLHTFHSTDFIEMHEEI